MTNRSGKLTLTVMFALIIVFGSLTWLDSADALVPKCKSDTHVAVVVAAPDAKLVDNVAVVHDVPGTCRNVANAPDDYDITINGHSGIHLLDSAADVFVSAVYANPGEPLTIEHTVAGALVPWRSFTPAAVQVIYDGLTGSSSSACDNPTTLTGTEGTLQLPPYTVQQDQWTGEGEQSMAVCSASSWTATANQSGSPETGVKTYPDSGKTYTDWASCKSQPALSSFGALTSTYGEVNPDAGSWDAAYDVFLNGGVCHKPTTEVMVWNEYRDVSVPDAQLHATIDGVAYDIYHSGDYVQVRRVDQVSSGSVDLLAIFGYLEGQGLVSSADTMQFVQYGTEILTTNGVDLPFTLNAFSVTDQIGKKP